MDLIVTDHHQPGAVLPAAAAIVHPALEPSYANQDSAGRSVAYKLAWAIAEEFSRGPRLEPKLREFMLNATSLAAIGTVADVVDLRGENRVVTKFGLQSVADTEALRPAGPDPVGGSGGQGRRQHRDRLSPGAGAQRGRSDGQRELAVELLTSTSEMRAMQIAEYLKDQNVQRQQCERKMLKQACDIVVERGLNHPDRRSIVLGAEDWHTGVLGIVASRLVDRFFRPTIMINASRMRAAWPRARPGRSPAFPCSTRSRRARRT